MASRKKEVIEQGKPGKPRTVTPAYSGKQPVQDGQNAGSEWWKLDEKAAVEGITDNLEFWMTSQRWRIVQARSFSHIYDNLPLNNVLGADLSRINAYRSRIRKQFTHNISKSCVDTVGAKIGKTKPHPYWLSSAGNYKAKQECEQLNRFLGGLFYETKYHELAQKSVQDALIWGEGWLHPYIDWNKRVQLERVPLDEIWCDDVEATATGNPRQLHRIKQVDKTLLKGQFPGHDEIIDNAGNALLAFPQLFLSLADVCTVRESWRLPSGDEPGAHIITVDSGALMEKEEYTRDHYPFVRLVYSDHQFGWFGSGLIEELESSQQELNDLCWTVQRSIQMASTFKWFIPNASGVNPLHLTDELGVVLTGDSPPVSILASIVQGEIYQQIENIINRMYSVSGVSQLSASGTVPVGFKSGEAQRVYNDINTERFARFGDRYEDMSVEVGKQFMELISDLVESGQTDSYKVSAIETEGLEDLDWKDLAYKPSIFTIQVFKSSSLPNDPEGRFDKITEMQQTGQIDPDTARRLLDFPDVDFEETLFQQQDKRIFKTLDTIVMDQKYNPPDEYDNLQRAQIYGIRYLKMAQNKGAPDAVVALLMQYVADVNDLQLQLQAQLAHPPPPPGAPGQPGLPPGAQVAPPQVPPGTLQPQ